MESQAATLTVIEEAVMRRRTVKEFRREPVPREAIRRLIELAVQAPNHRLTEPWRFYVFDGSSRRQLGEVARRVTAAKLSAVAGADPAVVERKAAEAAETWAEVPVLLYVTVLRDHDPEMDLENYGAACCALQNLALAAHGAGLATSWSSGAVAAAPELRELAGASENERLVGLIRIGYPDPAAAPKTPKRSPGERFTVWMDGADEA